jgi:hypothetical protein
MRFLLCLLLILSRPIFSQDDLLADSLSEEIEASDFSLVDKLSDKENKAQRLAVREQYYSEREKPWSPIPFRALLLKGTRLVDLKTSKVYYTSSDIYIYAQEETVGSQISYVLTNDKVAKYKTDTKNLRSIENDIALYPKVNPNKVYITKEKYSSVDSSLEIESHLTFHVESISNPFFADIYGGTETVSTANRFQSKTYYNSVLPIDFGLSLSLQTGLWNDSDNQVRWKMGSFGPSLRWQFAKWGKLKMNTKFGVERSFNFKAAGTSSVNQYSSLLYDFELEASYDSPIGPILFGWGVRKMTWQLERAEFAANFTDNKQEITSTSLFLGYRFDFEI